MKILSEEQKKQVCKVCNRCDSPDMDTIITLCDLHLSAQAAMTELELWQSITEYYGIGYDRLEQAQARVRALGVGE